MNVLFRLRVARTLHTIPMTAPGGWLHFSRKDTMDVEDIKDGADERESIDFLFAFA